MAEACRIDISNWRKGAGANAGLLRDRFLQVQGKENDEKKEETHRARKDLFVEMQKSLPNSSEVYRSAFNRQNNLIQIPKAEGEFKTMGRLIIGLGGENVLETGITLHHTYGTPIIPGTALKGLASHYCDRVWGANKPGFKRNEDYYKTIFGSTADLADKDSGHIIFHDAWITPNSLVGSLKTDVMTPHHSDYYSGTTLPSGELAAPTDFDSPNPITFLSIFGTFHIVVSCDVVGEKNEAGNKFEGQKWTELTFGLLIDALRDWGIGGKTNAGYGRLEKSNDKIA
jgi:CRISPR-associated protein Cmr6